MMEPDYVFLLEDYYYSTSLANHIDEEKINGSVECFDCKAKKKNNIALMSHVKHKVVAEWIGVKKNRNSGGTGDVNFCNFCYQQFDDYTLAKKHVTQVHTDCNFSSCRICEKYFENVNDFINHMKTTHLPAEMPYLCHVCQYRSSFYSDLVKHFKEFHKNTKNLFCYFCSMVFTSSQTYLEHAFEHTKTKSNFLCTSCRLVFNSKKEMNHHLEHSHISNIKHSVTYIVPLDVTDYNVTIKVNDNSSLKFVIPKTKDESSNINVISRCCECSLTLKSTLSGWEKHFAETFNCSKCSYITNCKFAFQNHKNKCSKASGTSLPVEGASPTSLPVEEASGTSLPAEGPSGTSLPAEEASATNLPAEKASGTSLPVEDASPTSLPAEEASGTSLPAEDASPTSLPAEKASPTSLPAEEASPTSLPAEGPSATSLPAEEASGTSLPAEKASATSLPAEKASATILPAEKASPTSLPAEKASATSLPAEKASEETNKILNVADQENHLNTKVYESRKRKRKIALVDNNHTETSNDEVDRQRQKTDDSVDSGLSLLPETPQRIGFLHLSSSSFLIFWSKPVREVSGYKIVFKGAGVPTESQLDSKQYSVRLMGLKSATKYSIAITPHNDGLEGETINLEQTTMSLEESRRQKLVYSVPSYEIDSDDEEI